MRNDGQTLLSQIPFGQYECVNVQFGPVNTDLVIPVSLSAETPLAYRWIDITPNGAATITIYRSATTVQQNGQLILRCNAANYATRLMIFTERTEAGQVTVPVTSAPTVVSSESLLTSRVNALGLRQSFRGLTLRTHPDADKAASQVWLDHADEIVMDDGTSVLDWNDLSANIAVNGAGGLDTGTELASTWYEIHAIRKSSDGTRNLVLHRTKNYLLDESNQTTDTSYGLRNATTQVELGQSFTVSNAGPLECIDILIARQGAPTGQVWFTIEGDNAGVPNNVAVATSDKIDVSVLGVTATWIRLIFRAPFTPVAGTKYHAVLQGNYAASDTVRVLWSAQTAGAYAPGNIVKSNDGTVWTQDAAADFCFKIYTTENNTAVVMPTGYDQRCLIGWVYNNSSSNFGLFLQHNRTVKKQYTNFVSGFTNTYYTLLDVASFVPPVPVMIDHWNLLNTAAGNLWYVLPSFSGGNLGILFSHAAIANYYTDIPVAIPIEFQHCYIQVNGGAGTFAGTGFTW